jgi:hypothetical protein
MKNIISMSLLILFISAGCQKNSQHIPSDNSMYEADIQKIEAMGFKTEGIIRFNKGYIVEGDIIIDEQQLVQPSNTIGKLFPDTEHYVDSNLVIGPRIITVRVNAALPARYRDAADSAIARYNALGLILTFQRVTTGGNIVINPAAIGSGFLAASGLPTSSGNPYSNILLNRSYLDTWAMGTLNTIVTHEIGHCIGFRHTDYWDISYSCGPPPKPGTGPVVHVPGTPTAPEANSWMLACIPNGVDRPFTAMDILALTTIY